MNSFPTLQVLNRLLCCSFILRRFSFLHLLRWSCSSGFFSVRKSGKMSQVRSFFFLASMTLQKSFLSLGIWWVFLLSLPHNFTDSNPDRQAQLFNTTKIVNTLFMLRARLHMTNNLLTKIRQILVDEEFIIIFLYFLRKLHFCLIFRLVGFLYILFFLYFIF